MLTKQMQNLSVHSQNKVSNFGTKQSRNRAGLLLKLLQIFNSIYCSIQDPSQQILAANFGSQTQLHSTGTVLKLDQVCSYFQVQSV
ncbi:hypothetical protein A4A49_13988 [Nicotiana attenuata]|uniref:Uncharacterized protein n=1 Tax=Nicotiana attenuata TaxID=49451 RepID=A0A314L6P8_NICAT|nr:hypothetical protein A4A49_13988 [Nicotiana attenuata]